MAPSRSRASADASSVVTSTTSRPDPEISAYDWTSVGRPDSCGQDDHRRQRPAIAAVADAEDRHDQERPEDQAQQCSGPPDDLDELLADEGQDPGERLEDPHAARLPRRRCAAGRVDRPRFARADELGEDLVEAEAKLPGRHDLAARLSDGVDDGREAGRRVLDPDAGARADQSAGRGGPPGTVSRAVPSNSSAVSISIASPPSAVRRSSSGGATAMRRPLDDERNLVALLGLVDVLGRDEQRPPLVAQAVELLPDGHPEEGIDAGGRLVEDQESRIVDERTGELEPSLHAAGQPARPAVPGVPQVEQLQDLLGPPPAARPEQAEQARHEVDVLAAGQVRIEREQLGHVADALPGRSAELRRPLPEDADLAASVGCRAPVIIRIVVVLPEPDGPMTPRIVPCLTTRSMSRTTVRSSNARETPRTNTTSSGPGVSPIAACGCASGSAAASSGSPTFRWDGLAGGRCHFRVLERGRAITVGRLVARGILHGTLVGHGVQLLCVLGTRAAGGPGARPAGGVSVADHPIGPRRGLVRATSA